MNLPSVILVLAALLVSACAGPVRVPPSDPEFAALGIRRVAVGPVAYAVRQPDGSCSTFIDEDFRSALGRDLRRRGYDYLAAGESVPRSFAPGPPPPLPGEIPAQAGTVAGEVDGVLLVWLDEYWENSLCGRESPKYLTMGAVGVLYAGSPLREVWRGWARVAEQGDYQPQELIWLATTRLAERLLASLPVTSGR